MKILVTGRTGQVAQALFERAGDSGQTIVAVGRPGVDFLDPSTIAPAIEAAAPDVIVNLAAYTAVDQAEMAVSEAFTINATAAGAVADAAHDLDIPLVHLSTDYVFDGSLDRPYRETDPTSPLSIYGSSKLAGEEAVAAATSNHAILRTAWVYSPFGKNFVRTMQRLGAERSEVSVVSDQIGSPTAAHDIADAVLEVARNLVTHPGDPRLRGVFHMTGAGEATWADLAEAVFDETCRLGLPPVRVRRITTADYPTPARRPANSRLDGAKLARVHGVVLPPWRVSLAACVSRLVPTEKQKVLS